MKIRSNRPSSWEIGVLRAYLGAIFLAEFRYPKGVRRSLLALLADIEADDDEDAADKDRIWDVAATPPIESGADENDALADQDGILSEESLRRFLFGVANKKSGRRKLEKPRRQRMEKIEAYMESRGVIAEVMNKAHVSPLDEALRPAAFGCDTIKVDPVAVESALWGLFIGAEFRDDAIIERILLVQNIRKEPLLRSRLVSLRYERRAGELDLDFVRRAEQTADWQEASVSDGFGTLDRHNGMLRFPDAAEAMIRQLSISGFGWNSKGYRILSFAARQAESSADDIEFRLVMSPSDACYVFKVLKSI